MDAVKIKKKVLFRILDKPFLKKEKKNEMYPQKLRLCARLKY